MFINKKSYIELFSKEFDVVSGVELLSADEVISWVNSLIEYVNKKYNKLIEGYVAKNTDSRLDISTKRFNSLPKIDIERIVSLCENILNEDYQKMAIDYELAEEILEQISSYQSETNLDMVAAQNTLNNLPKKEAVELSKTVIGCSDCSVCSGCKWLR